MSGNGVVHTKNGAKEEISIVRIKGYLDMITAEQLDKAIGTLIRGKRYNIIVDLRDVEYISSSGWGVFLGNIKEIREKGGDLKLSNMTQDVYEVYKVLEFFWFIKSYISIADAISDFDHHVEPMPVT